MFKKNKGNGEMISAVFVLLSMVMLMVAVINSLSNLSLINEIDQVERQALLTVEITGEFTQDNINDAKAQIVEIAKRTGITESQIFPDSTYGVYFVDKNGAKLSYNSSNGYKFGYGEKVYLCIRCNLNKSMFGTQPVGSVIRTYSKIKGTMTKRL